MLDLKLLTTFREVAVRGSFSDAAAALDFTQPAVSQHISRLETALGVRVLERNARGVSLTPAGEVLVRHASALLDAARRAEEAVRDAAGVGRAQVRVGGVPVGRRGAAARARRASCARAGRTPSWRCRCSRTSRRSTRCSRAAIDVATIVAVAAARPPSRAPGVEYLPICDDEMRIAVAADHPLATRTSVALEELRDEPFLITEVAGTCADSNVVLHAFRDAGFEPNVRFASDDYQALQGMAASGIGVALIPTMALDELAQRRRRAAAARPRAVAADPRRGAQGRAGPARRAPRRVAAPLRPRARRACLRWSRWPEPRLEVGGDLVLRDGRRRPRPARRGSGRSAARCPPRTRAAAPRSRRRVSSVAAAGQQALLDLVVGHVEVDDGVEVQALGLRSVRG